MSTPFTTTCPHCKQQITIPYETIAHHIYREHGLRSASKRKLKDPDYTRTMAQKRWGETVRALHPKQVAILELSKTHNLQGMTYKEIADTVGITGRHRHNYAWVHINRLQKKGLLPQWDGGKGWKTKAEE